MKVGVRLYPLGDGQWHWSIGRAGALTTSGVAESYEAAQTTAEAAARQYAADAERAQRYLFDTDSSKRTEYGKGP